MSSKLDSNHIGKIKVSVLRIIVYIAMGLTILLICLLPQFMRNDTGWFTSALSRVESNSILVFLILCFVPFLVALYVVKKICDLISSGDSFSVTTLEHLSIIVICCYIEAGINISAMIVFPIIFNFQFFMLNLLIIGICGAVAVFTTVLKELVKSAIRLREENELTI